MLEAILLIGGFAAGAIVGAAYAARQLRGEMSWNEVFEILGGGGPGPVKPK